MKRLFSTLCLIAGLLYVAPCHAALSIVHSAFNQGSSSSQTPGQVTLSGAPTAGNLILCGLQDGTSGGGGIVISANWTLAGNSNTDGIGSLGYTNFLWRYAQVGDTATLPAFTSAGSFPWSAACYEISGVTGTFASDVQVVTSAEYTGNILPMIAKSVTQTASALGICFGGNDGGGSTTTPPSGWTADVNNVGGYGLTVAMHNAVTSSGTVIDCGSSNVASRVQIVVQAVVPSHLYVSQGYSNSVFNAAVDSTGVCRLQGAPPVGSLVIANAQTVGGTALTVGTGWTEQDTAASGGTTYGYLLYRYAQNGDTSTLPALFSGAGNLTFGCAVYVISGAVGNWAADFQGDKTGVATTSTSTTTTSQTTGAANTLALIGVGQNLLTGSSTAPTVSNSFSVDTLKQTGEVFGAEELFASKSSSVSTTITVPASATISYIQTLLGVIPGTSRNLPLLGAGQ